MNVPVIRPVLLAFGVALLALALLPGFTPTAQAIPLAALTPTAEPPTRTSTPLPRPTVPPTDTPLPTNTPEPQPTTKPRTEPADPAVTKAASVSDARIGDIVDFTLTVTNHGGETADDVVVTDALPDFLDLLEANSSKGAVAIDGRTVVVTIGPVRPNEVIIIRIRTRVNELAQPPGGRNSVTLTTSNNSDDPLNNTASIGITILLPVDPTATPTVTPETPPLEPPTVAPEASSPAIAGGAAPHLPNTGAADDPAGWSWPLALLGLAAIGLSLLLRGRRLREL